jgi:hypothetical protein
LVVQKFHHLASLNFQKCILAISFERQNCLRFVQVPHTAKTQCMLNKHSLREATEHVTYECLWNLLPGLESVIYQLCDFGQLFFIDKMGMIITPSSQNCEE